VDALHDAPVTAQFTVVVVEPALDQAQHGPSPSREKGRFGGNLQIVADDSGRHRVQLYHPVPAQATPGPGRAVEAAGGRRASRWTMTKTPARMNRSPTL